MLSLPSQDRSKHNTSKIEMLVCQFLLNLHSFDCGKEFFKSVVCNDGSQQKIANSRFSLDAFCQKCGTGYLIEGGFKSSCPKHAHLVNNNIKSGCITIGMVKSDLWHTSQLKPSQFGVHLWNWSQFNWCQHNNVTSRVKLWHWGQVKSICDIEVTSGQVKLWTLGQVKSIHLMFGQVGFGTNKSTQAKSIWVQFVTLNSIQLMST